MTSKKTADPATVPVYSICPHEVVLMVPVVSGKVGEPGRTAQMQRVVIMTGDNEIPREVWEACKQRKGIAKKLSDGWLNEGHIIAAPAILRDEVWTGERDSNGTPILTPAGTRWTKRLAPKAIEADRRAAGRLDGRRARILTNDEVARL